MEKEPITVSGLKKIKLELEELKNIKRPQIVSAIAEARSHGDLQETAEYHAATDQPAQHDRRVIALHEINSRTNSTR